MNVLWGSKSQESWRQKPVALESWWDTKSTDIYRVVGVHDKQGAVVEQNEDNGINSHPCLSIKGETLRHQVKTLDEIEYIKSRDGDMKIQQDRLFVSIPLIELRDDSR